MRIQRASRQALDAARQQAVVVLQRLVDAVVDRLDLAGGVARADEEEVRVAEDAAHVELDDVDRLLVGRVGGDRLGELLWGHRYSLPRAMRSATASGTR